MPPPDGSLLLTGWLISSANFPRPLPKAGNLFHREEARHLNVLNGTSGYGDAGYSRCHCEAQQAEARKRRAESATLAELARSYHVGKSTISRLAG